jgi:K+-transporting ATPase KdpF subunit
LPAAYLVEDLESEIVWQCDAKSAATASIFTRSLCGVLKLLQRGYVATAIIIPSNELVSGGRYGLLVCGTRLRFGGRQLRADLLFRTSAEIAMSWIYILSGVLTVALLIYLVVALLYPEKF